MFADGSPSNLNGMKTDKLYYRIFLSQPQMLADLLPGLPVGYEFEYVAPVIKEMEFRLDGLLTPIAEDPQAPLIFIEAQMQRDPDFYRRFFAEIYLYLAQYKVDRPWRGLLILQSRQQGLGNADFYSDLILGKVEQLYLQDLIGQSNLSPTLALLQLIVLAESETASAAQRLLRVAEGQSPEAFQQTLDLVEAILIYKFPQLSTEEILQMLDLKTADIRETRFYQEVFQQGQQEGFREGQLEGEIYLILRQLVRRFGSLSAQQEQQVRVLSVEQLEALAVALFDFLEVADFQRWLQDFSPLKAQESQE